MKRALPVILLAVLAGIALPAQTPGRLATTGEALVATPVFFHGRQIAVRGKVIEQGGLSRLEVQPNEKIPAERAVFVYWKDTPSGDGEIRGEFWDLGRLTEGDARFTNYDFRRLIDATSNGQWPPRDLVFVILGATRVSGPPATTATVRSIAMTPSAYAGKTVTVSGRFRGRNLFGDVPTPINKSKWDFVIHSADAALWITDLRPRGKGFELDPGARVDTGRWVEVTGTVQTEGSRVWIQGTAIQLAAPPEETPVEIVVPVTKEAPPTVIFSAPVPDEVDVRLTTTVRLQFSRDMNGRSMRDQIRVSYLAPAQGDKPADPVFAATYNDGLRALEIKFAKPLERFQRVKVELLEGILATDGQPLQPWTLTFTTGS